MKQRLDQFKKLTITARLSLFVAALLLIAIGITINNARTKQEVRTRAASDNLSADNNSLKESSYIAQIYVTPTIYCLGSCPTLPPTTPPQYCLQVLTPARNLTTHECKTFSSSCIPGGWIADRTCSATPIPTQPAKPTSTPPVSQTPTITLSPTIPCVTVTPVVSANSVNNEAPTNGIIQQLLQLLIQLINQLLQLLGIPGIPALPIQPVNPTPVVEPTQSTIPVPSTQPSQPTQSITPPPSNSQPGTPTLPFCEPSPAPTSRPTTSPTPIIITPTSIPTTIPFPGVRSAAVYEPTWASASDGRSSPALLADMRAGFVVRGGWKWSPPAANLLSDVNTSVKAVRNANPGIIYEVGMTTAFLQKNILGGDQWPNGTPLSNADFDDMVMKDPSAAPGSVIRPSAGPDGCWI